MPPAIADSDDDGECEDLVKCFNAASESPPPSMAEGNDVAGLDGAMETRSTGSTERLRRDISGAQQDLMKSVSTPKAITSSPSTEQARKRRHTAVPESQPVESPPAKRVKRVKTTYSRSRTIADEDDGEVPSSKPRTSQAAHFSEHSHTGDPRSSAEVGLPVGSIGEDFANHEPAVLFKDSGSTIEDSSSVQKRYWEQARMSKTRLSSSNGRMDLPAPTQTELKSSSLAWWSASERTPGGNTPATNGRPGHEDVVDQDGKVADAPRLPLSHRSTQKIGPVEHSQPEHNPVLEFSLSAQDIGLKPQVSPIVEIPLLDILPADKSAATASTQKPTKDRRRRSEADHVYSEPTNSDDKAIGLPKERYVPRPSRRRATATIEEPIDYSVIPEKAAKLKRTKTSSTAASGRILPSQETNRASEGDKYALANDRVEQDSIEVKPPLQMKPDQECDTIVNKSGSQTVQAKHHPHPAMSSQDTSSSIAVKPKADNEVFAKPAMPPPSTKTSRSRRSHTTIFEDHIEFVGSQRSQPSLSQQQAKRKSALESSKEATPNATHRSRRPVILDDEDVEDDVDELAKDVRDEPAPQKRGRGRPPKSTAVAKTKSKDVVLEDSEEEEAEHSAVEEPKKSKRGRPSKAKPKIDSTAAASDKENQEATSGKPAQQPDNVVQRAEETNEPEKPAETPQNPKAASTLEIPTPSPEKLADMSGSTPQKASNQDPTSHSPIKSSSSVPYRVGLSKRHRIPSLLRIMRPPKP